VSAQDLEATWRPAFLALLREGFGPVPAARALGLDVSMLKALRRQDAAFALEAHAAIVESQQRAGRTINRIELLADLACALDLFGEERQEAAELVAGGCIAEGRDD
jgi:hypothetical protein